MSGFERGALCLDTITEMTRVVEPKDGHAAQLNSLLAARLGIDDGLSIV